MKKRLIFAIAAVLMFASRAAFAVDFADAGERLAWIDENAPHLAPLTLRGDRNIFEAKHIRLMNGQISIGPESESAAGVRGFFAPPVSADSFLLEAYFEAKKIPLGEHVWTPAFYYRRGQAEGIQFRTILAPAPGAAGFLLQVELENESMEPRSGLLSFMLAGNVDRPELGRWQFGPPVARQLGRLKFSGSKNLVYLGNKAATVAIVYLEKDFERREGRLEKEIALEPGEAYRTAFFVAADVEQTAAGKTAWELSKKEPDDIVRESIEFWEKRLAAVYEKLPSFASDNSDLDLFYRRAMLSFPLSTWDLPGAIRSPWLSTSGIDGGALCAYLWDISYLSQVLPMYDREAAKFYLKRYIEMGLTKHYAVTPYGAGIGPWYAYNAYAFTRLLYYYVMTTGDRAFLSETFEGKTMLEWLEGEVLEGQELAGPPMLTNYGTDENLLELKKTAYEGFTPSPNGERVWMHRAAAELRELAGLDGSAWRNRADRLAWLIPEQLWDRKAGWFSQMDESGVRSLVYTIQEFDLLRAGFLDREIADALVAHLNDREFLSDYGVHSLSKKDPGFDPGDVDWGGPGVYAGDAPELAQDLYEAGYIREADDLMRRILWWGAYMPYIPQAVKAGSLDYRHNGRANVNAGGVGVAAVVFGLMGVKIGADGLVQFQPVKTSLYEKATLDGLKIRGMTFRVEIAGDRYTIRAGDTTHEAALGEAIILELPAGEPSQ